MQSLREKWNEILEIPEAKWIVYGTLLVFAFLIAYYVSMFFRNLAFGDDSDDGDMLSRFRDLRDQGHLDKEEFDRLKSAMPDKTIPEKIRSAATVVGENGQEQTRSFITLAEAESRRNDASTGEQSEDNDKQINE